MKSSRARRWPIIGVVIFFAPVMFQAIAQGAAAPTRELLCMFDYHVSATATECVQNTLKGSSQSIMFPPHGIGAMTITTLLAIHQKAAPLLVSNATIQNIIAHKEIFDDLVHKDSATLRRKYGAYPFFSHRITLLKSHCRYVYSRWQTVSKRVADQLNTAPKTDVHAILADLAQDAYFNNKTAPSFFRRQRHETASLRDRYEMCTYLIAYLADLSEDTWIYKAIDNNTTLLLPRSYISQFVDADACTTVTDTEELTETEKKLGLRVNHLETKRLTDYKGYCRTNAHGDVIDSLKSLFVTHADYAALAEEEQEDSHSAEKNNNNKAEPSWALYLAGHGFPSHPVCSLQKQAQRLHRSWLKRWHSCLQAQTQDERGRARHASTCKKHHIFQRHHSNIESLGTYAQQLSETACSLSKEHQGIVVSLPKEDFRRVLRFFDAEISTALLFYTTCFSGGVHLVEPFQDEEGNPLTLSFPVICGGLAETASMQEVPEINLPPYQYESVSEQTAHLFGITADDFDEHHRLRVKTTLNFNSFLDAIRSGLHVVTHGVGSLVEKLHPFTQNGELSYERICNIPVWRPAGSSSFRVAADIPSTHIITPEFCTQHKKIKAEKLNLLYAEEISPIIHIKGGPRRKRSYPLPVFVSMQPGFAKHTFKQINAPCMPFSAVINSFMFFQDMSESKLFVIKKLRCASNGLPRELRVGRRKVIELQDVVVARNIFNLKEQSLHRHYNNCPMFSAAYLTHGEQVYRIRLTPEGGRLVFTPLQGRGYLEELYALCSPDSTSEN